MNNNATNCCWQSEKQYKYVVNEYDFTGTGYGMTTSSTKII